MSAASPGEGAARDAVRSRFAEFESLTDPRGAGGVRYRLSSLPALMVCATPAGHDSNTAAAKWCRRAAPEELAAFGAADGRHGQDRSHRVTAVRRVCVRCAGE